MSVPTEPNRPRIPQFLILSSLLTVTIWGVHEAAGFLIPLSFAALLAFLMTPLVQGFKRLRIPEWLAIILAVLVIVIPISTLGYFLSREVEVIIHNTPDLMTEFELHWDHLARSNLGRHLGLGRILPTGTIRARAAEQASAALRLLLQGLHTILSFGSEMVLVILLAVIMVISRRSLRRGIDQAFDAWGMRRSHAVLDESMLLIERFLIARLALVFFVAFPDLILLRGFGVDFFILLAVYLGVMTLIPAVGFILALIPTLTISLLSGNSLFKTFLLFLGLAVVSAMESHVLTPKWVGRRINLNLLTVFIGLFAGERLWGIPGMFLSLPLLAVFRILFSASPTLKPLGDLLAEREDEALAHRLSKGNKKKAA